MTFFRHDTNQALAKAEGLVALGMLTGLQVCEDLANTIQLKSSSHDAAHLSGDDGIKRYSAQYGAKIADALSARRLFGRTRTSGGTRSKAINVFSCEKVINLLQDEHCMLTQDKALALVMARHKR